MCLYVSYWLCLEKPNVDTTKMMLTQRPRAATASSRSCLPQRALPRCVKVMGGKGTL